MIFLPLVRQLLHYCLKIFFLLPFTFVTLQYFAAISQVQFGLALAVTGHSQQCTDPYEDLLAKLKPKLILTFNLLSLIKTLYIAFIGQYSHLLLSSIVIYHIHGADTLFQ